MVTFGPVSCFMRALRMASTRVAFQFPQQWLAVEACARIGPLGGLEHAPQIRERHPRDERWNAGGHVRKDRTQPLDAGGGEEARAVPPQPDKALCIGSLAKLMEVLRRPRAARSMRRETGAAPTSRRSGGR